MPCTSAARLCRSARQHQVAPPAWLLLMPCFPCPPGRVHRTAMQLAAPALQVPPTWVAVDVLQHLHEVWLPQERTRLQGKAHKMATRRHREANCTVPGLQASAGKAVAAGAAGATAAGDRPSLACGLVVRRASTSGCAKRPPARPRPAPVEAAAALASSRPCFICALAGSSCRPAGGWQGGSCW